MADQIVNPQSLIGLASDTEEVSNEIGIALRLANASMQFSFADTESVKHAQDELFFLLRTMDVLSKRLDLIAVATYDFSKVFKQAA